MTARSWLVDQVRAVVPDTLHVEPYARAVDPPTKHSLVLVRVDEVKPSPALPRRARDYTFGLVLVPRKHLPRSADDELDAALEDLLHALDEADEITWERATRGTYEDSTHPAYEVTVTVTLRKE